jgi:hypothetical protein
MNRSDNLLAYLDQGVFAQHNAVGRNNVIQVWWLYEHEIDFDAVRRFHDNLGYGLLGRRIERSPLPFARHRWVMDRGPADIDIDDRVRSRSELSEWADERSQVTIDPERGPSWHLGMVRLEGGATAVSLVLSHYVIDGLGLVLALIDGMLGNKRALGYPPPRSRPRIRAVLQDSRQTARDVPEVARALILAAKLARNQRRDDAGSAASLPVALPVAGGHDPIVVPGVTVRVDRKDWEFRAAGLGGTPTTLCAAFSAKFGETLGRRRVEDGFVTLQLPVSQRTEGDTRSHAMTFARATIDPSILTTDLSDARSTIKQAMSAVDETAADDPLRVAWLIPFMSKKALRRMDERTVADPDFPVFYSNLGDVGSVVNRLDGTDAEFATARVTTQRETRQKLERMGGLMTVQSLYIPDTVVISVNAYQPGGENTKPALRELAAKTLAEFGLTGTVE